MDLEPTQAKWSVDACQKQAYLSDDYISDSRERLAIYDRLNQLETTEELVSLKLELEDRYEELPFSVGLFFKSIQKQLK